MISHTTERFRKLLLSLPKENKKQAREACALFKIDPYYPGLHFKQVHSSRPIYSGRISRDYRALGIQQDKEIICDEGIMMGSTFDSLFNGCPHDALERDPQFVSIVACPLDHWGGRTLKRLWNCSLKWLPLKKLTPDCMTRSMSPMWR